MREITQETIFDLRWLTKRYYKKKGLLEAYGATSKRQRLQNKIKVKFVEAVYREKKIKIEWVPASDEYVGKASGRAVCNGTDYARVMYEVQLLIDKQIDD